MMKLFQSSAVAVVVVEAVFNGPKGAPIGWVAATILGYVVIHSDVNPGLPLRECTSLDSERI